ncbi:GTPase-activating protein S23 [Entophlyctis luteolus]|nr:GTPase-activating protein S23 [Entophlyctis luteolus]
MEGPDKRDPDGSAAQGPQAAHSRPKKATRSLTGRCSRDESNFFSLTKTRTATMSGNAGFSHSSSGGLDQSLFLYVDESIKQCKELAAFIKKKQAAEVEYAKALLKISASFSTSVPAKHREMSIHSNSSDQDYPKSMLMKSYVHYGHFKHSVTSVWRVFNEMLADVENTATAQLHKIKCSNQDILTPFLAYLKEMENSRKNHIESIQSYTKHVEDVNGCLKKAVKESDLCNAQTAEVSAQYSRAQSTASVKERDLEKLSLKVNNSVERTVKAQETVRMYREIFSEVETEYFNTLLPKLCQDILVSEEERSFAALRVMTDFLYIENMHQKSVLDANSTILSNAQSVEISVDSKEIVDKLIRKEVIHRHQMHADQHEDAFLVTHVFLKRGNIVNDWTPQCCVLTEDKYLDFYHPGKHYEYDEESQINRQLQDKESTASLVSRLEIGVLEAKDLVFEESAQKMGFNLNSYVTIQLGDAAVARTRPKDGISPFWVYRSEIRPHVRVLKLTVSHQNRLRRRMEIGFVEILLQSGKANTKFEEWYPIRRFKDESGTTYGSIRVSVDYQLDHVLPLENYKTFLTLLTSSDFKAFKLLGTLTSSSKRAKFAKTTALLLISKNLEADGLTSLIDADIASTSDPNIIFRSNSLATKAMDVMMSTIGWNYLQSTIGQQVKNIYESRYSCEVDPTKIENPDMLKLNFLRLSEHVNAIWTAILESAERVPRSFSRIFNAIQKKISAKWAADSSSDAVKYSAISGFIFLRFFCPSILSPNLFKLVDDFPDPVRSRTFKLVTKVIQNLANLTEFGQKEQYLTDFNPFIKQNIPLMKSFIDKISSSRATTETETRMTTTRIDLRRQLEAVYKQSNELSKEIAALRDQSNLPSSDVYMCERILGEVRKISQMHDEHTCGQSLSMTQGSPPRARKVNTRKVTKSPAGSMSSGLFSARKGSQTGVNPILEPVNFGSEFIRSFTVGGPEHTRVISGRPSNDGAKSVPSTTRTSTSDNLRDSDFEQLALANTGPSSTSISGISQEESLTGMNEGEVVEGRRRTLWNLRKNGGESAGKQSSTISPSGLKAIFGRFKKHSGSNDSIDMEPYASQEFLDSENMLESFDSTGNQKGGSLNSSDILIRRRIGDGGDPLNSHSSSSSAASLPLSGDTPDEVYNQTAPVQRKDQPPYSMEFLPLALLREDTPDSAMIAATSSARSDLLSTFGENTAEAKSVLRLRSSTPAFLQATVPHIGSYDRIRRLIRFKKSSFNPVTTSILDSRSLFLQFKSIVSSEGFTSAVAIIDLVADLFFSILYLFDIQWALSHQDDSALSNLPGPSYLWISRLPITFNACIAFSFYILLSWCIQVAFADNRMREVLSVLTFVNLLSSAPFIVSVQIQSARYLYIPYFLRALVAVGRLNKVLKLRVITQSFNLSPVQGKLLVLLGALSSILYLGLCLFQYVEFRFGERVLSIFDCFYFVIVTLATVGYGDIAPSTHAGQAVVILLIVTALTVLPFLITEVLATMNEARNGKGGVYKRGNAEYFVVLGNFDNTHKLTDALDGLLHEHSTGEKVVILARTPLTPQVHSVISSYKYSNRVTYLVGSGMDATDLRRAQVRHSSAVFVLADRGAGDHRREDERNTLRAWAIRQYAPDVPIFVKNMLPDTETFQELTTTQDLQTSQTLKRQMHELSGSGSDSVTIELNEFNDGGSGETRAFTLRRIQTVQKHRASRIPEGWNAERRSSTPSLNQATFIGIPSAPYDDSTIPECRLINGHPPNFDNLVVETAKEWAGHILVCAGDYDLFKFVCGLRRPSREEFDVLSVFPEINYMVGDPRQKKVLLEAGINGCFKVVILKMGTNFSDDFAGSESIMISHMIHYMHKRNEIDSAKTVVLEVARRSHIAYLHPSATTVAHLSYKKRLRNAVKNMSVSVGLEKLGKGKHGSFEKVVDRPKRRGTLLRADEENVVGDIGYVYAPIFAAGRVVAASMLDGVIFQLHKNPYLVEIMLLLCGVDRYGGRKLPAGVTKNWIAQIAVPASFVGLTYVELYFELSMKQGMIPMGLYRQGDVESRNKLPYVYTNPLPGVLLKEGDAVFEIEDQDGIRMSWNTWPNTRIEASRLVVPIGALYTPLKDRSALGLSQPLGYEPVVCKGTCRAILNPYCQIDPRGRVWNCPFCLQRNQLPPQYGDITAQSLPLELLPQYTTVEYVLNKPPAMPPVFLYVVDTCLDEDDLKALKDSLVVSLSLLPPNALVGLITFGTMTQVHELGYSDCPKSHVFRGSKEYTPKHIHEMLGLGGAQPGQRTPAGTRPGQLMPTVNSHKFLLPISQCEFTITKILENLQRDPWHVANDKRPLRCTGAALSLAAALLEISFQNTGARIFLFMGGACTEGPGLVVGSELREPIRSHNDISKDGGKHVKKATKFYEAIAARIAEKSHIVDIFAGCLDQVGLMEMKKLANMTNGCMVLSDSFNTVVFKQSFIRIFEKDQDGFLAMGFNATLEVQTSKDLKVCGLLGPAISANKKSACVSETEIGSGGTNAWKLCGVTPKTTVSVHFEVANQTQADQTNRGLVQFVTMYQHSSGQYRLRVTTIARSFVDPSNPQIQASFDQEAAAILMARIGVFKAENDNIADVLRWLDRLLIRLCQKFADYRKDDSSSFQLAENFSIYPQFMFHLRRSQFLQVFNNSPDETAYYRHILNAADVNNSLLMIQPTLMAYTVNNPPEPVVLDSISIKPDAILLLDTFFHVLIWHGKTVADWRKSGYHEMPQYVNIKELLDTPKADAQELLLDRFPIPRYIDTDEGGSQARFLLSKVNPSNTHQSQYGGGLAILTEDVSLQVFMEHLQKLSVSGSS